MFVVTTFVSLVVWYIVILVVCFRLSLTIGCKRISELSEEEFNWAFDLTKDNMETL